MDGNLVAQRTRRLRERLPPAPVGAATLYQSDYCAIAIDQGKQGKSLVSLAKLLNVDRVTIYRWAEAHEEFRNALSRARDYAQSWWEEHAQSNLKAKQYQSQLWRYNVAGRFKEDYGEQAQAVTVAIDLRGSITRTEGDGAKEIEATVIEQAKL